MAQFQIRWVIISTVAFAAVCSEDPVGGLPQKPEKVWVNIKDMASRQYYVHWQISRNSQPGTASSVSYSVRFHKEKGWCGDQPLNAVYNCNITLHNGVGFDEFQCKVKHSDPSTDHLDKYCNYSVSVIANTSVGEVESDAVLAPLPSVLPTPLPPLNFKAQATENQEIKVTWEGRPIWLSYDKVHYMIVYHADGQSSNKTAVTVKEEHRTLYEKDGIEAFKTYYLYMKAVIYDDQGDQHASSETIGPRRVFTPEGEPSSAPTIVGDTSDVLNDASFRNVTIKWEMPNQQAWQGEQESFLVYYRVYPQSSTENARLIDLSHNFTVWNVTDTSLNHTILPGLQSAQNYYTYMKMCNTKKCSSARGEGYIIKALPTNEKGRTQPATLTIVVTVSVLAVFLVLATLVGVYFYRKRFVQRPPCPPDLNIFVVEPNNGGYECVQANNSNQYQHLEEQESD